MTDRTMVCLDVCVRVSVDVQSTTCRGVSRCLCACISRRSRRLPVVVCLDVCVRVSADVHVDYPPSLTDKYVVGDFLAESALSVLKACTDR